MAEYWKGADVAAALLKRTAEQAESLRASGVVPTLAILRVGERSDDLSYERGAVKRCAESGIAVRSTALPTDVGWDDFAQTLESLNKDSGVHGILMLRPLPKQLDDERARRMLTAEKDVDGCTDSSLAGVFTNTALGFPPCTAEAVMEMLRFYGAPLSGRRAVILGRSLVVGRPLAMMLLHANATVTICHTHTENLPAIASEADILICATGAAESIGTPCLRPGQIVIDAGISWSEASQKLCGDVRAEEAEPLVQALTPVPGGVGSVTTAVLCKHVVEAAQRQMAG